MAKNEQKKSKSQGVHEMKVVGVAAGKGGVGKSTVSVNVTAALQAKGYKVGLLDYDPQGTNIMLNGLVNNTLGIRVFGPDAEIDPELDILIVDYPPGLAGKELGGRHDLLVVPFRPCLPDFDSAMKGLSSLPASDARLPVLTMIDGRSSAHLEILGLCFQEFGEIPVVARRSAFEHANNRATTVYGLGKQHGVAEARQSIDDLADKIIELIFVPKK